LGAVLNAADLGRVQMTVLRAETARQMPHVRGDQLEALVEDADQTAVPAHPERASQVFRRHRVISALDLDVAVAMDDTLAFAKVGKTLGGQRQERRFFHGAKQAPDLSARCAMNACVCRMRLPVEQEAV